jgi:hypothetical protein
MKQLVAMENNVIANLCGAIDSTDGHGIKI